MEFFELVERRHSVRSFTGEPVEQAAITRILKAALSAPSAKNTRSSSFMLVEEPELIGRIARMRDYGSAFVEKAPLVILVMGDQLRSDLWEVNAAISATYVQLAAQALELGSCWVHVAGRPRRREEPGGPAAEDYLRSFLPVPESRRILCAVAIGLRPNRPLSERRRYPTRMTGSSSCRETFFVGSGVGTFRRRTFSRNAAESFPSLDIMDYGE